MTSAALGRWLGRQFRFFRTLLRRGDLASDADLRAFVERKPFVAAPAAAATGSSA